MKQISIVTPIFCEEENIRKFYDKLKVVLNELKEYSWYIIFVDDGSNDNSIDLVQSLADKDERIILICLSRNFGKEAALTAGIHEAVGSDAIITIDADLQHPPEIIPDIIKNWEDGYPVVATVRKSVESHSIYRKIGSKLYYLIMEKVGGNHIIKKSTDFRLIDKKVAIEFTKLNERIYMYRGSIDWFGFKTYELQFDAPERFSGEGRYTYSKLFELAINSVTSFSLWPLKVTGYLGILITITSFALFAVSIGLNLYHDIWYISPIALLIVFITSLVGLLMMCLGLIALYIGNINNEVVKRPDYVISERHGKQIK